MKQNQVIFLTFLAGKSTASARISVPFKVKTLHTKAISLTCGDPNVLGNYVTIESDLVNNSSLGTIFNNSGYSAGTIQDIQNEFWNPQVIQGEYNFIMKQSNGRLYQASTGNDKVAIIIEYNSPDEII